MQMSGNTMLITGGTSGIGRGLAQRFHAEGNQVIVAGRRSERLRAVVAEHPGMAAVELDVTDRDSVRQCVQTVLADHPDLNVLVNNAGIMLLEDLTDPEHLAAAEATVATNLLGPIRMLTELVPFLTGQPSAVVMNVSSGLGFVPLPLTPTYSATKAALHSYTVSLRVQLAPRGIDVLELVPPAVRTDLVPGLADRDDAMPLEPFLDQVMHILRTQPSVTEVCVDEVQFLRTAEATGRHDEVLAMLSAAR